MSGVRHLSAAGYGRVAWRNGGGVTAEIAAAPTGSTLASGFDWRLSCAEVATTGPFSVFAGYDRILVQLSGAPMRLVCGDQITTLQTYEPHAFAGEDQVQGLVSEPVRDFNCIVRRGCYTAQVETLRLSAGDSHRDWVEAETVAVFMAGGSAQVEMQDAVYELAPFDTLLIDRPTKVAARGSRQLDFKACAGSCIFLLVTLQQPGY